jgi:molybdopterin molybdotransferase
VHDLSDARRLVLDACAALPAERVGLEEALGRIPATDGCSVVDLPPFDRSAMDGYAVRAADTGPGARLTVVGEIAAGDSATIAVSTGTAVAVTTGTALPAGADAVLQVEFAERDGGEIVCRDAIAPRRHVRFRGEDVRRADVLAPAGEPVNLQRLSALASAGVGALVVHRRARVRVLATGSELLPLGAPPEPGRIHESNRLVVASMAARAGAQVLGTAMVADDAAATRDAVARALEDCDVLLVTGGVSVGAHDHVKHALEHCGVAEMFWRVRLKPGKPLWFGLRGSTLVFGLPGNPLSAIAGFLCFVEPALRALHGEADPAVGSRRVRLTAPTRADDGRTTLLAATFAEGADGVVEATPLREQGSHLTGALARAHGFVIAPHDAGDMPAGALVEAIALS